MKPVLVFRESYDKPYKIYVLNDAKDYYVSVTDAAFGFGIEKVEQHSNAFKMFDTLEEATLFTSEVKFGVLPKADADIFCPKCERGYGTPYVEEVQDFEYTKECVCGHKMKVNVEVSVNFRVE